MNAEEIALEFEQYLKEIEEQPWGNHEIYLSEAIVMLRQQQAEIADLKLQNEYLKGCQPNIEIIAENERLKKELHMAEEGYALLHKIYFKKV